MGEHGRVGFEKHKEWRLTPGHASGGALTVKQGVKQNAKKSL
jgi:hypothetical protein